MADAATAIAHVLSDNGFVNVFRPRMPLSFAQQMPARAVVVRRVGGGVLQAGYKPTVDVRVDVRVYGTDAVDAGNEADRLVRLLHNLRSTVTPAGFVMWCKLSGGVSDQVESQTDWPFVLSSWQVYGRWLDPDMAGFGLSPFGTSQFGA